MDKIDKWGVARAEGRDVFDSLMGWMDEQVAARWGGDGFIKRTDMISG